MEVQSLLGQIGVDLAGDAGVPAVALQESLLELGPRNVKHPGQAACRRARILELARRGPHGLLLLADGELRAAAIDDVTAVGRERHRLLVLTLSDCAETG